MFMTNLFAFSNRWSFCFMFAACAHTDDYTVSTP